MLHFRTEIRNTPQEQTIKVYVNDFSLDDGIKSMLERIETVKLVEIQPSLSRNRVEKNLTIFSAEGADINELKTSIDILLNSYFSVN
jgi:hypothetical protein|tara:strand:+ start:5060 stop:5320 length:261 start_codon:yes stop_codon:yes gene_type:complete